MSHQADAERRRATCIKVYEELLAKRMIAERVASRRRTAEAILRVQSLDREIAVAYGRVQPFVKMGNRP